MIGKSLGRYHIREQLGEGGMGTVYKAFDTRLEREVAVKVILPHRRHAPEFLKRFDREAKALAKMSHPNIVRVLDYGEHDGLPFLVMEYTPGGTLKEKLGDAMPWHQAVHMQLPIARALMYAHEQKIIHRDVKPSNIIFSELGEPMLSDFGLAKVLEAEKTWDLTGTGVGIGTPEYMAPEQGIGKGVDHRADIYALGVVLYEMITGRPPYQADTPLAVLMKHINDPLPPPSEFVANLPERVEQVIIKALAKEAEDRFQSMGEFVAALANLLEKTDETVKEVVPVPKKRLPRPIVIGGLAILAVFIVAGLILGVRMLPGIGAQPIADSLITPVPLIATPTQTVILGSPTPAVATPIPELAASTPELPVQIVEVGFNDSLGSPHDVFVYGGYAYIADSFNGLRVVDISDRANPQEVGFFDPAGSTAGLGVYFSDPYVYLADGLGLLILDASDPTAPSETGFYDSLGFAVKVQLSGGYAYVAGREGGLNIADISDPANPQHVSNYFQAGSVHVLDVYVSGSYAYVAMQGNGLRVVDVSDPTNPQEVGFSDTAGAAEAVYVSGSYAYLADGGDGLRIFDISDPVNPQEIGFYDTPGYAQDVYLSGTYAFVGDGVSSLLLVIDVSDPANPQLAGEYETPGFVWGIYISDSYAYVANGEHGMLILRLEFE
ncbi:MAG: protein kinase [Anaerolineaceae bacterium]|nr:MAG: protein kinase [Anaerolineaceae bacterium]